VKHSEIKQNIIATASQLFYKNGYNLTGINEIIAASGIAKATLYNHFKSKEDICIAYLTYMNETFLKDIEVFCKSKKKGKTQVLAIFDFLQAFFKDKDFNGCWCIKTAAEIPKNNVRVKAAIQEQKLKFIRFIETLVTSNLDIEPKEENFVLAKQIYLLYESAVSESHIHQESWPISAAKNVCMKILA